MAQTIRSGPRALAGAGGKVLAALLVLWLLWLVAQNVLRLVFPSQLAIQKNDPQLSTDSAAKTVMAANLFGAGGVGSQEGAQATTLSIRLKGVYATLGGVPGFAIVSIDNRPDIGVVLGNEIKAGVKLQAVNVDHILIVHDGVIERVNLGAAPMASAAPGSTAPAALNVRPISASSYTVSRGEFVKVLADPRQLATLLQIGNFPGGGIIINGAESGGLISKLGFMQGDIIQKINGQPVAGKDDLLKLAQTSPNTSEVSVEGTRNGQAMRLTYNVQP